MVCSIALAYTIPQFHLRAYCVASGAIKVFLYEHVLALFSSEPFESLGCAADSQTIDLRPHLTNTCLQGDPKDASVLLLRELVGSTLLGSMFDDPVNPSFTEKDLESIMDQISGALAETFKAALQMPVHFQVRFSPSFFLSYKRLISFSHFPMHLSSTASIFLCVEKRHN